MQKSAKTRKRVRKGVKGKGIERNTLKSFEGVGKFECANVENREKSGGRDPKWELLIYTPAVFVPKNRPGCKIRIRVANAGLTGYGTWKSIRNSGGTEGSAGMGFDIHV